METLKRKLYEKRGEVALQGAIILLVAVIVFAAALEGIHIYHTTTEVKDKTTEAVLAAAAHNVAGIYQGVRESDWYARQYNDSTWSANADGSQVFYQLIQSTGGQQTDEDSILVQNSYIITNFKTTHDNTSVDGLNFTSTMTLEIFFKIGGIVDTTIPIDLEVQTSYAAKF